MPPKSSTALPRVNSKSASVEAILAIIPLSILGLTVIVLCYSTTQSPESFRAPSVRTTDRSLHSSFIDTHSTLTLAQLLTNITDALDHANVPYWLMPHQFLPDPASSMLTHPSVFTLTPWTEAVDLAVLQQDLLQILLAQATLQQHGIIAVESYFGLRFFHISGTYHQPYDFKTPFVDLFYFINQNHTLTSPCCDCAPVTIGACTKKLCTCLQCTFPEKDIFPLTSIRIQSLARNITAPRDTSSLLIPTDDPAVHPTAFTTIRT